MGIGREQDIYLENRKEWKRIELKYQNRQENQGQQMQQERQKRVEQEHPSSYYLIARKDSTQEYQKELLYRVLGPVFFGEKAAGNLEELIEFFRERYGIDVREDFCEGDEHYEEYQEAQQAIAEGMSIYGGSIVFEETVLAEMAESVWAKMEKEKEARFRRINTMLEE